MTRPAGPAAAGQPIPTCVRADLARAGADRFAVLIRCVSALLVRWQYPGNPQRAQVRSDDQAVKVCGQHDVPGPPTIPGTDGAAPPGSAACSTDRCGEAAVTVTVDRNLTTLQVAVAGSPVAVAEAWVSALGAMLAALAARPNRAWWTAPAMSAQQQVYLLTQLNHHRRPVPAARTLAGPFEDHVRRAPDRVALVTETGETLTYAELNARANRLAHHLTAQGCGPGTRVGIGLPRSVAQLVALYAAVKCGSTYIPLDLDQPPARLRLILGDADPRVVLTERAAADRLPDGPWATCVLEDVAAAVDRCSAADLGPVGSATSVAHLLYTSGTTGRPKGVATTTGSALANVDWMQHRYPYAAGETAVFKTSPGFDVSIWEIFWPLQHGARLLVTGPDTHRDPGRLAALVERFDVTQLFVVPSVMGSLVDHLWTVGPTQLRLMISGGETLPTHLRDRFYAQLPTATLVNAFGPCEAGSVTDAICPPSTSTDPIPVGTPAANFRVAVLDRFLQPTPIAVGGEAYISGEVGIAYGYWNNPRGTAERFVADPWGPPGARMYRTGDLCRFAADGRLVHLGRIDRQVKVRGLRVEPGEVETVLFSHPAVGSCAVAVEPDTARLVAFVVPAGGTEVSAEVLRSFAAEVLPTHCVPAVVLPVDALPVTVNGKLDTAALLARVPAPDPPRPAGGRDEPRPSGPPVEVASTLVDIYRAVLRRDEVGLGDTFIGLGGHSLLAFQLLDECQARLAVKPEVAVLLTGTVADVVDHITSRRPPAPVAATSRA